MPTKVRPALLPRQVTKPILYRLCGTHGKIAVLLELKDRHAVAVKNGDSQQNWLRLTIMELEGLDDAAIARRLTLPTVPMVYRIENLPTPPTPDEIRERENRRALAWLDAQAALSDEDLENMSEEGNLDEDVSCDNDPY